MELRFKCSQCSQSLEIFEIHYLPGETIHDTISDITYNTGRKYCKECYEDLTTNIGTPEESGKLIQKEEDISHIKELESGQEYVNIIVKVISKSDIKEIIKDGRNLKLAKVVVEDETGKIELTLWNDIIDQIEEGDTLLIENGYVREFGGTKQLTMGKNGKFKKIND